MAMEIQYQLYTLLLIDLFNIIFYSKHLRLPILVSLQPTPIEIVPCKVSSIVAEHNSINIHHRKDIDIESPC